MATIITSDCINCGACEAECPNTAIYQGGVEWELDGVKHPAMSADIFYIVRDKCTECVGFFDHEACAAVCPVDCCIPDPKNPETEDVLLARATKLHADKSFGNDFPSRFRKAGATTAAESAPPKADKAPAATPTVAAPTTKLAAPVAPTPAVSPPPASAPAPAQMTVPPSPPPAAKPQAPAKAPTAEAATPAKPAAEAASGSATPAPPEPSSGIPGPEEWEIPIECFRCGCNYAVAFKHFRSGAVLYCPSCHGSLVVTTSLYGTVNRAVRSFYTGWREQFMGDQTERPTAGNQLDDSQQKQLTEFLASVKATARNIRLPGAPRKRAGMFG